MLKERQITDMESRLVVSREEQGGSGMDRKLGFGRRNPLHLEWISNGILLYCIGKYVQSLWVEHNGS